MKANRSGASELDFRASARRMPVADCPSGEEVQVDTGWMALLEPDLFGERRKLRAWSFTSASSRHCFASPCFR